MKKYNQQTQKLKLFISFLKNNNIYNQFLYNLNKDKTFRNKKLYNPVNYIVHQIKTELVFLFLNAFDWSNTKQLNENQWDDLHEKWLKFYYSFSKIEYITC